MSKPSAITVSRSKRGTTVKATGAAAQRLFDALAGQVEAKAAATPDTPYTVQFEDHGQDFLEWDVSAEGKVVACRPAQAWLWVGATVLQRPIVGEQVRFSRDGEELPRFIKYRVTQVTQTVG